MGTYSLAKINLPTQGSLDVSEAFSHISKYNMLADAISRVEDRLLFCVWSY